MTIILFIVGILGRYLPVLSELVNFTEIKLLSIEPLKQIAIIVMAILLSTIYGTTRKHTKPINLIEWIGYTLLYYYRYWTKLQNNKETVKEPWSFSSLEQQSLSKISTFHSQQTAIFIVVTLFIVMLIGLNYLPST